MHAQNCHGPEMRKMKDITYLEVNTIRLANETSRTEFVNATKKSEVYFLGKLL